jgi:hypothetical protein
MESDEPAGSLGSRTRVSKAVSGFLLMQAIALGTLKYHTRKNPPSPKRERSVPSAPPRPHELAQNGPAYRMRKNAPTMKRERYIEKNNVATPTKDCRVSPELVRSTVDAMEMRCRFKRMCTWGSHPLCVHMQYRMFARPRRRACSAAVLLAKLAQAAIGAAAIAAAAAAAAAAAFSAVARVASGGGGG